MEREKREAEAERQLAMAKIVREDAILAEKQAALLQKEQEQERLNAYIREEEERARD